jgi:predicted nucleic acid-binding protein
MRSRNWSESTGPKLLLMSTVVLDAWAALAFLQREGEAWVAVRRLLRRAVRGNVRLLMNVVNLGEVYYRLVQIAGQQRADERFQRFRRLPIEVLPAREALALSAARVKAVHPISYADAFAVATAKTAGARLATGDPEVLGLPRAVVALMSLQRS